MRDVCCSACLLPSRLASNLTATPLHSPPCPQELTLGQFASQVKAAQERYAAGKAAGSEEEMKRGAALLDETQVLFIVGACTALNCRRRCTAAGVCPSALLLWKHSCSAQQPPASTLPACLPPQRPR